MAAAERAVTEIVFDAAPAEDGARRVERAGKTIIDTGRKVADETERSAKGQAASYERSARATEMAAAAMRSAQSAIQTTANVAASAAQSTVALAGSYNTISAAINVARRNYVGLAQDAAEMSVEQDKAASATNTLTRALAALGLVISARSYIDYVDSMSLLNARIGLVTKSTNEFLTAQRSVYTIAQAAAQPIQELGELYTKVATALTPLGLRQAETLNLTETIAKAMKVGGGEAAGQAAALVQLGQAFSSGTLRGEELNSVLEQAPRLARAIAEGMGITVGALRSTAEEGKITSAVLANALRAQKDVIAKEFAALPITVSAEMTRLNNAVMTAMAQLDKSAGISSTIGGLVDGLVQRLGDQKFLDQVGAILSRLGAYAKVAADAIGFLLDHLNGAMLVFAAFSGAKGLLLAVSAMNTFSLGTKALTASLGALNVTATATQTTIAGIGAAFAISNPISAMISLLSAAGIAYLALADHSSATSRAIDASNQSIDATRATAGYAARSLDELADSYGKANQAAQALEKTNLETAIRKSSEALEAQRAVVRQIMADTNRDVLQGFADNPELFTAPGLDSARTAEVRKMLTDFFDAANTSGQAFAQLHLQISEVAKAAGLTEGPMRQFVEGLANAAKTAGAMQENVDANTIRLKVLSGVIEGATAPTYGLSTAQMELAKQLGLVGSAASNTAATVAEAVAGMQKSLSATGGDLTRDIARAQSQLVAANSGGIRAVENLRREQSAADEAQRSWAAARQDLAKNLRANIPEQLDDALKSDNMTIRLEADRLKGQVKTLADTRNAVDLQLDKLRKSASSTKTEANQIAKNEKLVDTLQAEFDAREKSERAMAQEAATRRLNAKATEDERKEVDALAGSLYDLKAARDQDARLAQANVRKSTIGMTDEARAKVLENTRIASEATRRYGETVKGTAADTAKQEWISKERIISETEAAATAAEKFAQDVKGVANDVSGDVAEAMYDGFTGKADSIVDWFKSLLKRLAVEAIKANIILPIVTQVVGSAPGLFGISSGVSGNLLGGSQSAAAGGTSLLSQGGNSLMSQGLSYGADKMGFSTAGLTNAIDSYGYSALGIGSVGSWAAAAPASVTAAGAVPITSAASLNAATGIAAAGNTGAANILYTGAANGTSGAGISGGLGSTLGAAAPYGMLGGMLGSTISNNYMGGSKIGGGAVGAVAGVGTMAAGTAAMGAMGMGAAASAAGVSGMAGATAALSAIPVYGWIAAAVLAAVMAIAGSQKPSVGPNAQGNVLYQDGRYVQGPTAADNGGDDSNVKTVTAAVAQGFNVLADTYGIKLAAQNYGYWEGGTSAATGNGVHNDPKELIRQILGGATASDPNSNMAKALANSTVQASGDLEEIQKYLDVAYKIDTATEAFKELNKSLTQVEANAKKAAADGFAAIDEEIKTADKINLGSEYRASLEQSIRTTFEGAVQSATPWETAMANLRGETDAWIEAVTRWNVGVSEAEIRADAAAKAEKLRADAMKEYDTALYSAQGRDYLTNLSAINDNRDTARRNLAAVGVEDAAGKADALITAQLANAMSGLGLAQLTDVTTTLGGAIGALAETMRVAAQATATEDLTVRSLRAQGQSDLADVLELRLKQEREYAQAVKDGYDATYLAGLQYVHALDAQAAATQRATVAAQAQAAAQAAAASYAADIQSRVYAAVGNNRTSSLLALDQRQATELAQARANGYDVTQLQQVQAAERASQAFTLAQQDVLAAYDSQISAQQELVTSLQNGAVAAAQVARQFKAAFDQLAISDNGLLSPLAKLEEARTQFEAAYGTAKSSTATEADKAAAQSTLQSLGPSLIQLARDYYASSNSSDYERVRAVFGEFGNLQSQELDTADQQLEAANRTLTELQRQRADAANIGQRQYGALADLNSVMNQSYSLWQSTLIPLLQSTGYSSTGTATTPTVTTADKRTRLAAFSDAQIESAFGGFADIIAARQQFADFDLRLWFQNFGIDEVLRGQRTIPGFATGTDSAPPGMAWVGENGRELVQMAGGERVYPHDVSMGIAQGWAANDRWSGVSSIPRRGGSNDTERSRQNALLERQNALLEEQNRLLRQGNSTAGMVGDRVVNRLDGVKDEVRSTAARAEFAKKKVA